MGHVIELRVKDWGMGRMTRKQWSDAWRLLGYIEGANDTDAAGDAHDVIQEAVNALADILNDIKPEDMKK